MLAFRVTVNEAILCLEIKLILAQGCQAGQYWFYIFTKVQEDCRLCFAIFFYGSPVLCFDIYTTVFEQFGNYKAWVSLILCV